MTPTWARRLFRIRFLALPAIALAGAFLLQAAAQPSQDLVQRHRVILDRYCAACHNDSLATAGLSLQNLDIGNLEENGELWEKILRKLRNREMPPAGMPRPDHETYTALVTYLESERDRLAELNPHPGRPALHRLNRTEYQNAIRDLLALEIDSTELLPADDIGYGFDNIGDVLNVSPLLLERYLSAASRISRIAIGDTSLPVSYTTYEVPHGLAQLDRVNTDMPFGSRGGATIAHHFPVDAEYVFTITLQRNQYNQILGQERERLLDLRLENERIELFTIPANRGLNMESDGVGPVVDSHLEIRVPVDAGTRTIAATFMQDRVIQEGIFTNSGTHSGERKFFEGLGSISIAGPYAVKGPGDTASRDRIFVCYPTAPAEEAVCAEEIVSTLARRAYRRPVTEEDLSPLLEFYQQRAEEGGFENGIRLALQTILVSPEFLFRMEFDPPGVEPGSAYPISDLELASRLSFFLWSTLPDDELLVLAEAGRLSDPDILEAQVLRMLGDTRSQELIENFAGQWLFLRNIERVEPDPVAFPDFDDNLRHAMQREVELLVEGTFREDQSVVDLLDADYTFVNERLARHYGIEGIYGSEFRRIALNDERRYGLLGKASILTVTSYPNRTAPTIRGKWVLEQILGTPPPPPPPNVPSLAESDETRVLTMRERMEQHRANPACAVCHRMMDPLGFALENFDGIGRWRETTGGSPIDSTGVLPDGTNFDGPAGLRDILLSRQELFVETFTERLLTYALGRGVEQYDHPVIRKIVREAADDDYRWSSIILGIVRSTPFQMRSAADEPA